MIHMADLGPLDLSRFKQTIRDSGLKAKIAGLKKQLEDANLPADQRAALLKQLDGAGQAVEDLAK